MERINIKKHLDNQKQQKNSIPPRSGANKPNKQPSLMDSPMAAMIMAQVKNMPSKYKAIIWGISYLILMGIVGTIYFLVKLILLFI